MEFRRVLFRSPSFHERLDRSIGRTGECCSAATMKFGLTVTWATEPQCLPTRSSTVHHNTEVKRKMLTRAGLPVEYDAEPSAPDPQPNTLICFSHLRWNFVFQRPQHLMSRFARSMNVIYWEEPDDIVPKETAYLKVREAEDYPNVRIVLPHLPEGMPEDAREAALKRLLDAHVASLHGPLVAWYYTPMMLPFSRHLEFDAVVFDAMDELSKFRFPPP